MINQESSTRPSWDKIWSDFATNISQRSIDPKHKVGAVIVTADNTQVLALGYNGDHKGGPNTRESMVTGQSGFIHAEINALIKCDYNNPKRKIMYVTLSPCIVCAKAIINAGISEVVYIEEYTHGKNAINVLNQAGISVRRFKG